MKLKTLTLGTSIAIAALSGQQALAYEAGDIIVRAGIINVTPDESSDGIAIPALGVPEMSGTRAEVDDDTQIGLTVGYMLNSAWGIELLAATPFTHDITANLGGGTKVDAGETTQLPPTLSLIWYPLAANELALQPYIGLGLNYTIFFEEDANADLEALAGQLAGASGPIPLNLKLENSWGLSAQVGADYALNEKWHINASIRWIDIDTEAKFTSKGLGTVIVVDNVEIDPWVYQLNIGYTF